MRIYFLAEARYEGELTKDTPWTGKVAWANKLSAADRARTLALLKLPADTGPATWWLTEFEDNWPYETAAGDVYFSPAPDNDAVARPPVTQFVASSIPDDIMACAIVPTLLMPCLIRRLRRKRPEASLIV